MKAAATLLDRYWFLDQVAGWRVAFNRGLELTKPDGNLMLNPLPGAASLSACRRSRGGREFTCPSALFNDGYGNLLVADAATNLVKRIKLANGSVRPSGDRWERQWAARTSGAARNRGPGLGRPGGLRHGKPSPQDFFAGGFRFAAGLGGERQIASAQSGQREEDVQLAVGRCGRCL